ncbi:hypothetical protein E4U17_003339, partial [Claviceps sp. LM77 group G4]
LYNEYHYLETNTTIQTPTTKDLQKPQTTGTMAFSVNTELVNASRSGYNVVKGAPGTQPPPSNPPTTR